MKYVYDDILNLRLTRFYLMKFIDRLRYSYGKDAVPYELNELSDADYTDYMCWTLGKLEQLAYKDRGEYKLAKNAHERAIVAMMGPPDGWREDVLKIWVEVADKMPKVDKALEGWDKL